MDKLRLFWQSLEGMNWSLQDVIFLSACLLLIVYMGRPRKRGVRMAFLDQVLFYWTPTEPYTRRSLVRSVCVIGAAGSGKTSGSGHLIAKNLVRDRSIGLQIHASKPEELEEWERRWAGECRVKEDFRVFGPKQPWRCNFLQFELDNGADTRELTEYLMVLSENLQRGQNGGSTEPFWREGTKRYIYNGIEIVTRATGKLDPATLQQFIVGAARTPQQTTDPTWEKGSHLQMIKAAYGKCKTDTEFHDWQMAWEFFVKECPSQADKMRSGFEAGVFNITHVLNTGIVRHLIASETNITPAILDEGKSIMINMPVPIFGAAGALVNGAWKLSTQRHILRRKAVHNSPITILWLDEFQHHVNSEDAKFLCECRSHHGGMIVLTQSLHNFYSELGGKSGEHYANALLTNFGHKIAHSCGDDQTAGYFAALIGNKMRTDIGGSMSPGTNLYDEVMGGQSKFSGSFSSTMALELEHNEFFKLPTGGPANGFLVGGIVIRSGEPFRSTGKNWLRVNFNQK